MPVSGSIAAALVPGVQPQVIRWHTGKLANSLIVNKDSEVWRCLEVKWDEGTPASWPTFVSPWEILEDEGGVLSRDKAKIRCEL